MNNGPEIILYEKNNTEIIYNKTLNMLKKKASGITIRGSTIHLIIKYVMEAVEDTPIKGVEQKEMALKLTREIVIDFTAGEDEKVLLDLIDNGTIGNMIDLIVDASNGKLNINAVAAVGSGCISSCIPYFLGKKSRIQLKKKA